MQYALEKTPSSSLKTNYIQKIDFSTYTNPQQFFRLLQFLVYAHNLDYMSDSLGSTRYRRVKHFFQFTNQSDNYYQLDKLLKFFDELQNNPLIQFFSNSRYLSLITIPEVKLNKNNKKSWVAEVWIAEELFSYPNQFLFPGLLEKKINKA